MKRDDERYAWSTCVCGKKGYVTRHAAKQRAKQMHPGRRDLTEFRCKQSTETWHFGRRGNRDHYRERTTQ